MPMQYMTFFSKRQVLRKYHIRVQKSPTPRLSNDNADQQLFLNSFSTAGFCTGIVSLALLASSSGSLSVLDHPPRSGVSQSEVSVVLSLPRERCTPALVQDWGRLVHSPPHFDSSGSVLICAAGSDGCIWVAGIWGTMDTCVIWGIICCIIWDACGIIWDTCGVIWDICGIICDICGIIPIGHHFGIIICGDYGMGMGMGIGIGYIVGWLFPNLSTNLPSSCSVMLP